MQRALYTYAARALLGPGVEVEAGLLHLRGDAPSYRPLKDGALDTLAGALVAAVDNLERGGAVPGPDAGGVEDALRFALGVRSGPVLERKKAAAARLLGDAAAIWGAP